MFFRRSLPLSQGDESLLWGDGLISWADDLPIGVVNLFHPMGAPAHDAGDGKQGVYSSGGMPIILYTKPEYRSTLAHMTLSWPVTR